MHVVLQEQGPDQEIAVSAPAPVSLMNLPPHIPHPPQEQQYAFYATLHTDGASRGNPGEASCGGVLEYDMLSSFPDRHARPSLPFFRTALYTPLIEFGVTLGIEINNIAQYRGLLVGLDHAKRFGVTHIKVYLDSQIIVKQMNGTYAVRNEYMKQIYSPVCIS